MREPIRWWQIALGFVCMGVFFGMHALYLLWEPLIAIPIAFWAIGLWLAFSGTFTTKRR